MPEMPALKPRLIRSILVPLDGTSASEAVLPYIEGMAAHLNANLVFLTCVPEGLKSGVPERQYLERLAIPIRKRGLGVATTVREAEPGQGIVQTSLSYETDIIAIAIDADPTGKHDLLGTVIREVLTSRVEPVLVLRDEDGRLARERWTPPSAVVVGLDGSALSATALPHAEALANMFNSEIVLVRAVLASDALSGAARYYGAVDEFAERHLAGVAEALRLRGFKVAPRTGHRLADQEILAAADSWPGSLIVLSTRGMTGRTKLVLGSVTERVIHSKRHPVFVVPAARPTPLN